MTTITGTKLSLSNKLLENDPEHIRIMAESTNMFSEEEIAIATGFARYSLTDTHHLYHFLFVRNELDIPVAYTCFGHIPTTENRYDLYWVIVSQEYQDKGIGSFLLAETENAIKEMGGKHIYLESSSLETYAKSRNFYAKKGFREVTRITDFYRENDDKIVFQKILND